MVVAAGRLRTATKGEIADLETRDLVPWEPVRLPGLGKEGLARFLASGGASAATSAEGFLITCTCGHLFLEQLRPAPDGR